MHHKTNLIPFWNAVGKYGLRDSKHWQNKIKAIYSLNDHVYVRGFTAYKFHPYKNEYKFSC